MQKSSENQGGSKVSTGNVPHAPDPEVSGKPQRRRFTAEYKLRIVREADRCSRAGEVGALLRREGLYSSLLSSWRREREEGKLQSSQERRRGPKPTTSDPAAKRLKELERENERLRRRLDDAQRVIDVQKKISELFDMKPAESPRSESDS